MHALGDELPNITIQEIEWLAPKLWPLVEHENQPAEVEEHDADDHAINALPPNVLDCFDVRLQVSKRSHEDQRRVYCLPGIFPNNIEVGLQLVGHANQIVWVIEKAFVPNVAEGQSKYHLNVVRDVRDKREGHLKMLKIKRKLLF